MTCVVEKISEGLFSPLRCFLYQKTYYPRQKSRTYPHQMMRRQSQIIYPITYRQPYGRNEVG